MVCPNCGKDCGDSRFCSECGSKLDGVPKEQDFAAKRQALRAAGQAYCPCCLSTSISLQNGYRRYRSYTPNKSVFALIIDIIGKSYVFAHDRIYGDKCVCLSCGNEWYSKRWGLQERYAEHTEKLLGAYPALNFTGLDGTYLQLTKTQVMIKLSKRKGCVIRYDDLAMVDCRESKGLLYGRLTLRNRRGRRRPLPTTLDAARKDKFTILYTEGFQEGFAQVYAALNAIVEENKKAGLI
jgi:hypothetical protein